MSVICGRVRVCAVAVREGVQRGREGGREVVFSKIVCVLTNFYAPSHREPDSGRQCPRSEAEEVRGGARQERGLDDAVAPQTAQVRACGLRGQSSFISHCTAMARVM